MALFGQRKCKRCGAAIIDTMQGGAAKHTGGGLCASCNLLAGRTLPRTPARTPPPSPPATNASQVPRTVARTAGSSSGGNPPLSDSTAPQAVNPLRFVWFGCLGLAVLMAAFLSLGVFIESSETPNLPPPVVVSTPTDTQPVPVQSVDDAAPPETSMVGVGFRPPRPANNPGSWVNAGDYPPRALQQEREGTVRFRLEVDKSGRPTACVIMASSGHGDLDRAACDNIMRRAKFAPARDSSGNPATGMYSNNVRWQIPD